MEEPGRLQSVGTRRVRHNWTTSLSHTGEGNGNSSVLAWRMPEDGGALYAAVYGVAQSRTWLKRLSSSSIVFTVSPSICHEVIGPDAMILVFWMLSFKPTFSLSSFIERLFSSSLSAIGWYHLHIWSIDISPSSFDSSFCFIQPNISHDVLCI